MTHRTDGFMPVSERSRLYLRAYRSELHDLATSIDRVRSDMRTDMSDGIPIEPQHIQQALEAATLLYHLATSLDPDKSQIEVIK